MRRFIGVALAALFLCCAGAARAGDRTIYYFGLQPLDSWLQQEARDVRVMVGAFMMHAGLTGTYSDLTIAPSSGLYVVVEPSPSAGYGGVYQQEADDASPIPAATVSPEPDQLPADTATLTGSGFMNSASSPIGPLTAPSTSGQSIYYLIEAQLQPRDINASTQTFLDNQGNPSTHNVPETRSDVIAFAAKAGTAATSPTVPTVDSGWISIGWVEIAYGQSTISGGITMAPGFNGWAQIARSAITPSSCAFWDANGQLTSGGCNTSGGAPTTVSAGSSNITVVNSPSTNYVVDLSLNPTITSLTTNTASLSGNATENAAGTATGSQNYGSAGAFRLTSSIWSGGAPQSDVWSMSSDTATNLDFGYNGANQMSLSPSGVLTATGFSGNGSGLTNLFSGLTAGFCAQATSTTAFGNASGPCAVTNGAQTFAGLQTFSSSTPFAFSSINGALFTSNATGSAVPFTYNASNGSSPTGDMLDIQKAGVNVFQVLNNGGITSGGNFTLPSTASILFSGSAGQIGVPGASFNAQGVPCTNFGVANNGSAWNLCLDTSGNLGVRGSLTASGPIYSSGSACSTTDAFQFTNAASETFTRINACGTGGAVQGITPAVMEISGTSSGWQMAIDGSGNVGVEGSVWATNFFNGSRRAWKTHISPYKFDALSIIKGVDYAEYDCKNARCGPPGTHRIGIIADDSPSQIAGAKHDHFDGFAMAAIDGKAIVEISKRMDGLEAMVRGLCKLPQNRKVKECARFVH